MKRPTTTQVKTRTTYDSMSLTVIYPTGGTLKYKINRSGETLEVAFSPARGELHEQTQKIKSWIGTLTGNNQQKMDRIKAHFERFTGGRAAVDALPTLIRS